MANFLTDFIGTVFVLACVVALGATVLAVLIGPIMHINFAPEIGEHSGYVTETGVGGLIFKTHFAKVNSQQIALSDAESSWYYAFSEPDINSNGTSARLYETMVAAQRSNSRVTVKYDCVMLIFVWDANNNCLVKDVFIEKPTQTLPGSVGP